MFLNIIARFVLSSICALTVSLLQVEAACAKPTKSKSSDETTGSSISKERGTKKEKSDLQDEKSPESANSVEQEQVNQSPGRSFLLTTQQPMVMRTKPADERKKDLNTKALHRLDFQVQGSGCATCLGRLRKRLDGLKAVLMVAVAIQPPYGVSVIYDSTKIKKDKLCAIALKDEKLEIKIVEVSDEAIDEIPSILAPKCNYFPSLMTPQ